MWRKQNNETHASERIAARTAWCVVGWLRIRRPHTYCISADIRFVALHTPAASPADFYLRYTTCYNHGWGYNARENVESSIACRDASCMYGWLVRFSLLHSIFIRFMKHRGLFISCILLTTYSARKRNGSLVASYNWCIHKNSFSHTAVAIPITAIIIRIFSSRARCARAIAANALHVLTAVVLQYDCTFQKIPTICSGVSTAALGIPTSTEVSEN